MNAVRARHVRGSGNLARAVGVPLPVVLVGSVIAYSFAGNPSYWAGSNGIAAVLIASIGSVLIVRSFLWGTWVGDDKLIIHSWLRTTSIPFDRIATIGLVQYSGMLNFGNIDYTGQWVKMFRIDFVRGRRPLHIRGSLSLDRSATKQLLEIQRSVGLPPTPTRSAEARTHRRPEA